MTYPRVLMVFHSCVNDADASCMSLRSWFADWPKESLAQIYSGNDAGAGHFCGRTFRLGYGERRFSRVFFRLKASPLGDANRPARLVRGASGAGRAISRLGALKQRLSAAAINSGIWELLFPPVMSPELDRWIREFRPDIIYAQGYDLSFAWLAVWIMERYGLPGCFHAVDDWPRFLYRTGVFGPLMRPKVDAAARALIASSSLRYSIGPGMAEEYRTRYGVEIEPLMICDSVDRFSSAPPRRMAPAECISIIYTGGLGHKRWRSLLDLSAAASLLEAEGMRVRILVFTASVPPEAAKGLGACANVRVEPLPAHEELPGVLKGGDILFLPETFDDAEAEVIRFSVSTKAPLYMLSGTPILVYASPVTGVMTYARDEQWGLRVEVKDPMLLADAIRRLSTDGELRRSLAERGEAIVNKNHASSAVRERLRHGMLAASNRGGQVHTHAGETAMA